MSSSVIKNVYKLHLLGCCRKVDMISTKMKINQFETKIICDILLKHILNTTERIWYRDAIYKTLYYRPTLIFQCHIFTITCFLRIELLQSDKVFVSEWPRVAGIVTS